MGKMLISRRAFIAGSAGSIGGLMLSRSVGPILGVRPGVRTVEAASPVLTRYVDPLPIPGVHTPLTVKKGVPYYEVTMTQFLQQLHSQLPPTPVWGYNNSYPGPTFEARMGVPISVKWINNLPSTHLLQTAIDPTIPDPAVWGTLPYVRTVAHLHGGFTPPQFDGLPLAWFTSGKKPWTGPGYVTDTYTYPNAQQAATLWYHDHALGITRLNVYAGLAGFYLIRDAVEDGLNIPKGAYEIPIVIQDRMFNPDGTLFYPNVGVTAMHPIWVPEFFGDVPVVNGKAFPYLEVEPRRYRFRLLNGSQARFYNLWFDNGAVPVPFYQIGTDGGFLGAPVPLQKLLIAPGERADIIFDFTGMPLGTVLTLKNNAKAPFPGGRGGEIPNIMQFRVTKPLVGTDTTTPPQQLILPPVMPLGPSSAVRWRDVVLVEALDAAGNPIMVMINGKHFEEPATEDPRVGTIEVWQIINITADAHPIHLHLVQFQILNRQPIDAAGYMAAWMAGQNPVLENYLAGPTVPAAANEAGWKDTVRALPGEVTRIIAKFDVPPATKLPAEYVYHCHILEHEDNDMMRPYRVVP